MAAHVEYLEDTDFHKIRGGIFRDGRFSASALITVTA